MRKYKIVRKITFGITPKKNRFARYFLSREKEAEENVGKKLIIDEESRFFMPSEHENYDIYVKVNGEEIPLKEYEKRQNNT